MDDAGTELPGGSILVEDGVVRWVGVGSPPGGTPADADVVDGRGCVAIPGLVNTHHHLYQVLTRARAQDRNLFGWLTELYPVWAGLDAEWVRVAATAGLAELALSGCTTSTDQHYVFPAGAGDLLAEEIEAARVVGCASIPAAGRWTWACRRAGCRPTWSCRTPTPCCARPRSPSRGSMTPGRAPCCASRSRRARPSPSAMG